MAKSTICGLLATFGAYSRSSSSARTEAEPRGGHVRVGLEDAPWGTEKSNLSWLEEAVELVRREGGEPATAAEIRALLRAALS